MKSNRKVLAIDDGQSRVLKRDLQAWQILLITLSGIIGVTVFQTCGAILAITGPAGLLTGCVTISLVAILVMEGLSEMVELWPISNAMVEFVKRFVDEDLGTVVGIAYWYTFSSIFATLIIEAATLTEYWSLSKAGQIVAIYCLCPIVLLAINFCGVKYFGYVECVGGVLKFMFVAAGAMMLFVIAPDVGPGNITDGFQNGIGPSTSQGTAFCLSLPVLAYGFIGVEIVSVTAFEAADRRALQVPARWIAYVIASIYFACFLGAAIDVKWNSPFLPVPTLRPALVQANGTEPLDHPTTSALLIAVREAGILHLPGFFNACIIFAVISASNTALYVSSRTLFGLARNLNPRGRWPIRWLSRLGTTTKKTRVPAVALVASAVAFFWLPFLHLNLSYSVQNLVEIMATTGSVGGLLVWSSQCLAFIRYFHWFSMHKDKLTGRYLKYNRWQTKGNEHRYRSILALFQPFIAYLGLIGSLLVVLVFNSANWWSTEATVKKVAVAYAGPIILLSIWILLKLVNRRRPVKLERNWKVVQNLIHEMEGLISEGDNMLKDARRPTIEEMPDLEIT